jgi:hypothetical protein
MHILTKKDGERRKKRFAAIGMATFVTLAGAGAAFAYWTTSGTGAGNATSSAPSAIVVNQTTTVSGLYPGDTVALAGTFTNTTNPGSVFVTSVTASIGTFSTTAAFPLLPACTNADFTITGTSTINTVALGSEVTHGTNVGAWAGLSITLTDSATNQDNCESLTTIPINYTAS